MKHPVSTALILALVCSACGGGGDASHPFVAPGTGATFTSRSSTLLLSSDQEHLWVTSPDDDQLVEIAADDLQVERRVEVDGMPERVVSVGGRLVVSGMRSQELTVVDPTGDGDVRHLPVPCGGTAGMAVAGPNGARVFAACPFDDRVVEVDLEDGSVLRVLTGVQRPWAVAVLGGRLFVSSAQTASVSSRALTQLPEPAGPWKELAPQWTVTVPEAGTPGSVTQMVDLAAGPNGGVLGIFQRVDNLDRDLPPDQGGYASGVDGNPRIEPMVYGSCEGRYAVFDGGARVFSGPSALAYDGASRHLWVVNRATRNVAVLDCAPPDGPVDTPPGGPRRPLAASFEVGHGARGIVLSKSGEVAWVDVGFDHAVARLELADDATGDETTGIEPTLQRTRETTPTHLSSAGEQGRRLFYDAKNTHLTPTGVVACATCHPRGGEDGLVWFLHTDDIPAKLRRTPPAWDAKPGAFPLHWDGHYDDPDDLVTDTIRELMEGDALVVDVSAVSTYMEEIPPPVGRPLSDDEQARAERGAELFESAGCADCHTGAQFTDGSPHAVVEATGDAPADLAEAITPSLVGIRGRDPYLHDGRARSLRDVLTTYNTNDTMGVTSRLSADDVDDLVLYLETL